MGLRGINLEDGKNCVFSSLAFRHCGLWIHAWLFFRHTPYLKNFTSDFDEVLTKQGFPVGCRPWVNWAKTHPPPGGTWPSLMGGLGGLKFFARLPIFIHARANFYTAVFLPLDKDFSHFDRYNGQNCRGGFLIFSGKLTKIMQFWTKLGSFF